jgi:polyferredoxin
MHLCFEIDHVAADRRKFKVLYPSKVVLLLVLCLIAACTVVSAQESAQTAPQTNSEGQVGTPTAEPMKPTDEAPGVWNFLTTWKYILFFAFAAAGLVLLLGRWINLWVRLAGLVVIFVVFGMDYFLPLHPSPMCGITKLFMFKFTHGQFFPAFVALFLAMFIPSLIGRKLFCGWVCPLGALQELVNKIPSKLRFKQFNFTAFNSIRMSLLVMFVLTFFMVKDQITMLAEAKGQSATEATWRAYSAYSLYDPINFFEFMHWNLDAVDTTWVVMILILVGSSYLLYRPFCYTACPIGALTWLLELVAPGRVRVDHSKCNGCGVCVKKSPCPTIAKLIDKNTKVAPDCTSCGECLGTCPTNAIKFGFTK